jgi:hypothetical protein
VYGVAGDHLEEQVSGALRCIGARLAAAAVEPPLTFASVFYAHVFVSSMADFVAVNGVYKRFFPGSNPASRACVEVASLPPGVRVAIDAQAFSRCAVARDGHPAQGVRRSVLHVRSVSLWAPANIGPYSQANQVRVINARFCQLLRAHFFLSTHSSIPYFSYYTRSAKRCGLRDRSVCVPAQCHYHTARRLNCVNVCATASAC